LEVVEQLEKKELFFETLQLKSADKKKKKSGEYQSFHEKTLKTVNLNPI